MIQNIQAYSDGSIMAWTCMTPNGMGSLTFIDNVNHDAATKLICFSKEAIYWEGTSPWSKTMTQNTLLAQQ